MPSENNKLLIITGAGASYDLVNLSKVIVPVNCTYRPPLTKNIFKAPVGNNVEVGESSCIAKILEKHSLAEATGIKYYINHSSKADPKTLEQYLFELRGSEYLTDRRNFWAVPYYLQELFREISNNYLPGKLKISTNYMFLLDQLKRSPYKDIVWLNLNYDLFVDNALKIYLKEPGKLQNIDEYMMLETVDASRIKYTKPHGSVDWVQKFKNKDIQDDDVQNGRAPKNFEKNLEEKIYLKYGGKIVSAEEHYLFPAISTPTGEYDFVCQEHKKEIEKAIKEIDAVLCIGFSALDKDILQVMKNMPPIQNLLIVNGGYDAGRSALENMKEFGIKINGFGGDNNNGISPYGFSGFIGTEKIVKLHNGASGTSIKDV